MIKTVLRNDSDFVCDFCRENHKLKDDGRIDNPKLQFVVSSTALHNITDKQAEERGANFCTISKVGHLKIKEYYKHDIKSP